MGGELPFREGPDLLAEFLDRGYYDAHLASLQAELDARYVQCIEALSDTMPPGVRWTTPGGGPILWVDLPRSVEMGALTRRLAERNVTIDPSTEAFQGEPHLHGFRLGYAFSPAPALRKGLEILAEELRKLGG